MFLKKISLLLILLFVAVQIHLSAQNELLKPEDVSKVMQQIFQQHVDKKEISTAILKNAFKIYIDQFDPFRIYLTAEETDPWLNPGNQELAIILGQYKENDFSAFSQLNQVIQKAIERSRTMRSEIYKDGSALFAAAVPEPGEGDEWEDPDLKKPFPNGVDQLRANLRNQLIKFIGEEKRRFGTERISKNEQATLHLFDGNLRQHENSYLLVNKLGQPLSPAVAENEFILHVLKALTGSLDAHTTFYNNQEAYDVKVRLEKNMEGIGVVLNRTEAGDVIISKLLDGGPAALSKQVQVEDKILTINGQAVTNSPLDKVVDLIKGNSGSSISLVLLRNGQEYKVDLIRAPIALKEDRVDVSFEKFENGIIGKITLHAFYQGENGITSENDVRNAIKDLSKQGNLLGLVLDLRENSGGFLTQAVKVAGLFITNGVVVISKYSDGKEQLYRDMDGKVSYKGPLIILTSRATASAAEIVAQALQDYGVALVVGDAQTYGKGTIQSQTVTEDGAASFFKVTVGKYYTVSGHTPQIDGVMADIVVPGKFSQEHIGEKYLENALKPDTIAAEYNDDLNDVQAGLRAWYLRYYMPTLQHKTDSLKAVLPTLKENSAERLSKNADYQAFLNELKGLPTAAKGNTKGINNFNADDLQMAEAVNIVKDIIVLESASSSNTVAKQGVESAAQ